MLDVEVKGQTYRLPKLPAMQQLHVSRRLSPLLAQFTRLAGSALEQTPGEGDPTKRFLKLDMAQLTPLAEALASLPDADVDYIIATCMANVMRKMPNDTGWAKVWASGNMMMFDDIEMPELLNLVVRVLWYNLRGFMPAAVPSSLPTAAR